MSFMERVTVDIADVLNESDESDQEYTSFSSRFLVEDFDIANFYRSLCSANRFNNPNRRHQKSVTVQTDAAISNIPPSWLIESEKLVDELYTGLGNIINSIYYKPKSCKKNAMKRANLNPSGMKYFTLENGYWRSKLLPSIKIPDLIENDRSLFLEDTKRTLFHLLEVATKLRNVIPDVSYLASCENSIADDGIQPYFNASLKVEPLGDLDQSKGEDVMDLDNTVKKTDLVEDLVEDSSDSEISSVSSQENYVRNVSSSVLLVGSECHKVMKKQVVMDDCYGSDAIPGVKVLRYALASQICTNDQKSEVDHKLLKEGVSAKKSKSNFSSGKMTYAAAHPDSAILPSCSNVKIKSNIPIYASSREGKRALCDQENCNKGKSNRGNREKNFIRKNILDLKSKCNRSISVTVENSGIINTEPRGTTQNGRRTSPPREEMHHRFLR